MIQKSHFNPILTFSFIFIVVVVVIFFSVKTYHPQFFSELLWKDTTLQSPREPDVQFIVTPMNIVYAMLELANIKENDVVYDLGCGDGRIVITAAKKYGCHAVGFDIDPMRVKESWDNVKKNNLDHLVRIEQKDIFTIDLSKADVITMYLLPKLNVKLIPQLEKMKHGSRIVSHYFNIEGLTPDKEIYVRHIRDENDPYEVYKEDDQLFESAVYLWTIPFKKSVD